MKMTINGSRSLLWRPEIHRLDLPGFTDNKGNPLVKGWMSLEDVGKAARNRLEALGGQFSLNREELLQNFAVLNGHNSRGEGLLTWTDTNYACFEESEMPVGPAVRMDHLLIPADWGNRIIDFAHSGFTKTTLRAEPQTNPCAEETKSVFMVIAHHHEGGQSVARRLKRRYTFTKEETARVAVAV